LTEALKECITRVSLEANKMSKEERTPEEKYRAATRMGAWGWLLFFLVAFIIFVCVKAMIDDNNYSKSHYYSPEQRAQDADYERQLQEHEEKTGGW
jgi:hypothetical protein